MQLLLIRHAKAEDHGLPGGDRARALVEKGVKQSERVGEFLVSQDLVPDLVLTSPVKRAAETAQIICQKTGIADPVTEAWLACGMRPKEALLQLAAYQELDRVAIVGHEPDFSALVTGILGARSGHVEVKKASVILLTVSPPRAGGILHFNVPPKFL